MSLNESVEVENRVEMSKDAKQQNGACCCHLLERIFVLDQFPYLLRQLDD